jgi:hypothetical protein
MWDSLLRNLRVSLVGHPGTQLISIETVSTGALTVSMGAVTVSMGALTVSMETLTVSIGTLTVSMGTMTVSMGTMAVSMGTLTVSMGTLTVSMGPFQSLCEVIREYLWRELAERVWVCGVCVWVIRLLRPLEL